MSEGADDFSAIAHEQIAAAPRLRAHHARPMPPGFALLFALLFLIGFVGFWYVALGVIPNWLANSAQSAPSQPAPSGHPSWVWSVAKYGWVALLTWMLARDLRRGELPKAWAVARQVSLRVVGQNFLVVLVTIAVALGLYGLFPWLNLSWLYFLPGHAGHAANIVMIPVHIKYFGIAFLLLLAASVPNLARSEEMKYRRGTVGWKDGAARSLRFGLAHWVMGIPLYAALALTVGGLWFTLQYFRGGVEHSTLHHATYNWIVLFVCLAGVVFLTFGG